LFISLSITLVTINLLSKEFTPQSYFFFVSKQKKGASDETPFFGFAIRERLEAKVEWLSSHFYYPN
jgi:hypothetical protein